MKNVILKSISWTLILLLSASCQQNTICLPADCLNGGVCNGGSCDCPAGVTGSNCETVDSCYNVTCYNLGYCEGGQCICPPGYGGVDCSSLLIPVSMTVTKITLVAYPFYKPSNQNWDTTSPWATTFGDAYFTLNTGGTANHSEYVSEVVDDVNGPAYSFDNGLPITLNLNTAYTLGLWDYDGYSNSSDDFMSLRTFKPVDFIDGRPADFMLTGSYADSRIYVTWNY